MNTTPLLAASATALALATAPASAGADFEPFVVEGFVEGGYSWDGPAPGAYFLGDVDLAAGFAGGFGANLGVTTAGNYDGTFGGNFALYPTLSYDYGTGMVSAGIPRSVLDRGYLPGEAVFGSAALIARVFNMVTGSVLQTPYATDFGDPIDMVPLGARWDGRFNTTKLGVSAHYLVGDDMVALAAAGRHAFDAGDSFDEVALFGGAELITNGTTTIFSLRAGAEADFGRGTLGVLYGYSTTALDHTITAYGDYAITEAISVDGSLSYFSGGPTRLATLGAEYSFLTNGYANASVGIPLGGLGAPTVELSVGMRF